MSVVSGPFTCVDHARLVQLFSKTNQFNATTRRYTSEEIIQLTDLPNVLTLQFRLLDRIGDNGLVSAMILRPTANEKDVLKIDNWVMSCRVFGRGLEFEAMNIAVETAQRLGMKRFIADYIATPKNGVISELYPSLGFTAAGEPEIANGATRWLLDLADYATHQSHIVRAGVGA
jgi:FkbH-like protein